MACIGSGESLDNVSRTNSVLSAADGEGQHAVVAPSISAGDGFLSKVNQRKEVLKLIGGMNATVGVKTAEQGLLKYVRNFNSVSFPILLNQLFLVTSGSSKNTRTCSTTSVSTLT